jgi:hypothetical protein
MDQDEIFVEYEKMIIERVFQENYNLLIHDRTFESHNDLNMVYCLDKYEVHRYTMKEYLNERN